MTAADLIIVGAGSAGCVLASRWSAMGGKRVVLIEPKSPPAPWVDRQRPARWINLLGSSEDWNRSTARSKALAGRSLRWPRGRGLGGSGRINAMIWFPPTAADYRWLVEASGRHWDQRQLEAAFNDVERAVSPEKPRWLSDAARTFLSTVHDWPDARPMIYRRVNRYGRRWTPAEWIVDANEQSQHACLNVVRAEVRRLRFEADQVAGVEIDVDGSLEFVRAREAVVLSAGAIETPRILMRSGIGPREELLAAGIDVRVDSPRVGSGLQDHLIMPVIFELSERCRFSPRWSVGDLAQWQHGGGGPLTCNLAECGGLFDQDRFQVHVTPTHYLHYPDSNAPAAMTVGVNLARPTSRGRCTVSTHQGELVWRIVPRYLTQTEDLQATIEGVRLARQIANRPPLVDWHCGELLPGKRRESDESIAKAIARYAQTLYHPAGTCGLGWDADSVVDPDFRVRGIDRLSVVDASILPGVPCGNPNATVMMLARLAADRIVRL